MIIYHITLPDVWKRFEGRPSFQPASLQSEGFIHCSYPNQIEKVIRRYYRNASEVLILHIETDKLRSKLVEEPSTNNEIFPHIYGRLNRDAVVDVETRILDHEAVWDA